jgi:hypothetical protein
MEGPSLYFPKVGKFFLYGSFYIRQSIFGQEFMIIHVFQYDKRNIYEGYKNISLSNTNAKVPYDLVL